MKEETTATAAGRIAIKDGLIVWWGGGGGGLSYPLGYERELYAYTADTQRHMEAVIMWISKGKRLMIWLCVRRHFETRPLTDGYSLLPLPLHCAHTHVHTHTSGVAVELKREWRETSAPTSSIVTNSNMDTGRLQLFNNQLTLFSFLS